MDSERDQIFHRLHQACHSLEQATPYPEYDSQVATAEKRVQGDDPWEVFSRNFRAVNGRPMDQTQDVIRFLQEKQVSVGYCDPSLEATLGEACRAAGLGIETSYDRERYDDYHFGITRATGAIAETGSVILTDTVTSDRLAALTPWIHIAVLTEGPLLRTLADAIAAFGDEPNVIWATGPSKTADIEGILIEGVHGPGEQLCLRLS